MTEEYKTIKDPSGFTLRMTDCYLNNKYYQYTKYRKDIIIDFRISNKNSI